MTSIQALSNAQGYARYVEQEGIGEWMGAGARSLGLIGEVGQQEYRAVCRGEHPESGEYLLPFRRMERVDYKRTERLRTLGKISETESIKYHSREAYSIIFSSPKTVSIQGLYDPRMLECHERAVSAMIPELERLAGGDLVIAAYQHRTSRAGDPLIHTHLIVANMQKMGIGWRSTNAIHIYMHKAELTEKFEREVLRHAESIGYRTTYPHLDGISQDVFSRFCQRSGDRETAIQRYKQEHGLVHNCQLSDRQVAGIVYWNRGQKEVLPPAQIRQSQLARLTPAEHTQLLDLKERALERQQIHERVAPTPETETPKERRKLSLRDGVHSEPDLKHEQWNYGESPTYRAGYKVRL